MSINKDNRTEEEIKQDIQLLGQKPEIDRKLKFYEGTMLAIQGMFDACKERIERGFLIEEKTFLGFIKIKQKKFLDSYDVAKLKLEMNELEADVFIKKGFFKIWMKRKKEFEKRLVVNVTRCLMKHLQKLRK